MLLRTRTNSRLISQLDTIMGNVLRERPLPVVYENKIRLENLLIKKASDKWIVYDTSENIIIAKTHYRKSAIILAKVYLQKPSKIKEIVRLDSTIFKHSTDIDYYENSIKNLDNEVQKSIRLARLCDSETKLRNAEDKLLKYAEIA